MVIEDFKQKVLRDNPLLVLGLGLCPAVAITTSAADGLGMGLTVAAVTACSQFTMSLARQVIAERVRSACYMAIVAAFTCTAQLALKAFAPELEKSLGIFVPLIAVNCLILGRGLGVAAKNPPLRSLWDGLLSGLGFALALTLVAGVREVLGNNTLFGLSVVPHFRPVAVFAMAPGGFIALGFMAGLANHLAKRKERSSK